jgi:quinol monooxygenase YgiN
MVFQQLRLVRAALLPPVREPRRTTDRGGSSMYGTVARLRIKPGQEAAFRQLGQEMNAEAPPGYVFSYVYRMDADPHEILLAVGFESEEAYRANAESPEQHQRYEQLRSLLDADPEWRDGQILDLDTP